MSNLHLIFDPHSDPDLLSEFFERFSGAVGSTSADRASLGTESEQEIRTRIDPATVSMVLLGTCTWSRAAVDWEIQAALASAPDGVPNGLLALTLDRNAERNRMPERLKLNVKSGYARLYRLPRSNEELAAWVRDAGDARRERRHLSENPPARQESDLPCDETGEW